MTGAPTSLHNSALIDDAIRALPLTRRPVPPRSLRVCCFGSSSSKTPTEYLQPAAAVGYLLAVRGHVCVNGAGSFGCMAALNEGAVAGDGHIVGVIHEMWLSESEDVKKQDRDDRKSDNNSRTTPGTPTSNNLSRWGLERPLNDPGAHAAFTPNRDQENPPKGKQQLPIRQLLVAGGTDLQERKKMLIAHADALVVLPGGPGTFDELWEVACARNIGLSSMPIVCVNVNNFYEPFKAILERAWEDNLTKLSPDQIIHFADTAEQAIQWVEDVTIGTTSNDALDGPPILGKTAEKQVLRLSSVMGAPEVGRTTESNGTSCNADDWDSLLDPYQVDQAIGRQEGQAAGRQAGRDQGYSLGQTTALNYGVPLGFVQGIVTAIQQQESSLSPQALKTLQSLHQTLEDFPQSAALFPPLTAPTDTKQEDNNGMTDDSEKPQGGKDSPNVREAWQRIQTRFRLLMVQLGRPDISLEAVLQDPKAPNPSLTTEW